MTQYEEVVERQRQKIEVDKWAEGIKCVHIHQMKSMWYDDRPQDTDDGSVMDIQHNNGLIVRSKNGKEIHRFGEAKTGLRLVRSFLRHRAR